MRLYSDEYRDANNKMFDALKMASKFDLESPRRLYWNEIANKYKEIKDDLKRNNRHLYNGG